MKKLALRAALALGVLLAASPAHALMMCAPLPAVGAAGPQRIVNPANLNAYTTNPRGCANVGLADVGYFAALGFLPTEPYFAAQIQSVTASPASIILPPRAIIRDVIVQETSGAAVTGGLRLGTTSGGNDVMTAYPVAASSLSGALDASLAKRVFSATLPQAIFIDTPNTFNNSALTITIIYGLF